MARPMGWSHDLTQAASPIPQQLEVKLAVTRQYIGSDHEVVYLLVHTAGYYRIVVVVPGAERDQAVIGQAVDARHDPAWDKAEEVVRKWRAGKGG